MLLASRAKVADDTVIAALFMVISPDMEEVTSTLEPIAGLARPPTLAAQIMLAVANSPVSEYDAEDFILPVNCAAEQASPED